MRPLLRLALISDLHLKRDDSAARSRLRSCLDSLFALQAEFDALLVCGDLIDRSYPDGYGELRDWLRPLHKPYFLIRGNHDVWDQLSAAFPAHHYLPAQGRGNWLIEDFPLTLIGLDSIIPDSSAGILDQESLAFLRAGLAAVPADKGIVLALHHPPVGIGLAAQDAVHLHNAAALAEIVQADRRIRAVLCGHAHSHMQGEWAGCRVIIAPSAQNTLHYSPAAAQIRQMPISGGWLLLRFFPQSLHSLHIPAALPEGIPALR